MQTVSHRASQRTAEGPLHESEVFVEAMIETAVYGLTGRLPLVEALEQIVVLGDRVETFLQIARAA